MSVPTGCWARMSRIVLTIEVTGWFSANQRTGPGMVSVGTKAELMKGRKMRVGEGARAVDGLGGEAGDHREPGQREGEQDQDAGDGEPRQDARA